MFQRVMGLTVLPATSPRFRRSSALPSSKAVLTPMNSTAYVVPVDLPDQTAYNLQDPEYNVLGKRGIRGRKSAKEILEDGDGEHDEVWKGSNSVRS